MTGLLVLVVGPSGSGKDTLMAGAAQALAGDARFRFVRRVVTRPATEEDHEVIDAEGFAARRDAAASPCIGRRMACNTGSRPPSSMIWRSAARSWSMSRAAFWRTPQTGFRPWR